MHRSELPHECESHFRALVFSPVQTLPVSPTRSVAQTFISQSANPHTSVSKAWEQRETLTFLSMAWVKCASPFHSSQNLAFPAPFSSASQSLNAGLYQGSRERLVWTCLGHG